MRLKQCAILISFMIFLSACATYKPQYKDENKSESFPQDKEIVHSFYFIGDAGNSPEGSSSKALTAFKDELAKAARKSTAIFLGDNIYPDGLPKKSDEGRAKAEHQLNIQTEAVNDFKGRTIFIPGNHDWYSDGLKGLKRQEEYIEDRIGKNSFLPENGCPIEKVDISDDIVLILIDSEWYLTNWNNHPNINDDCDITTRAKFFDEYESLIKKARGKTTIVALHHPMFTNGSHGGQYSFGSHMSPLPVLGTIKNVIRNAGGVTTVDIQNKRYNAFRERIITLSQQNNKTIFVSGHDHNLQYIVQDNLPQIISGSGSKKSATRNVGGGQFSYGTPGYARLDIFKDGSSHVRFYKAENNEVVFQTTVLPPNEKESLVTYPTQFSAQSSTSVYSQNEVDKSKFYRSLWGERYRNYYATKVQVPTVNLDTLYGGLKPVRKGGGHQSKSLRLEDQQGREFVMRAVRKNAIQYLQAVAFKDNYIEGQFEETYIEDLLLDIFTGAHPYAPLTIGPLADAVGVYHTNPVLYFVPKQNALRSYNSEFGNELYMIEERAADGHGDKESFGYSDELISTDDLLKELKKDEDNRLDEAAYIRARLFDMLIGDWDRHEDQWRWAKFKEDKSTIYRPVPRDRDQAFSIMSDGAILSFASKVVPALRLMQSYDEELKSPKWFNLEPYPLDIALINQSDRTIWNAEVTHIVENLTDEIIDEAFDMLPPEVNDETVDGIKRKLKGRRSNLQKISDSYYQHVNKFAVIKGTDKDDWFDIERMPNGLTKVTGYRIQQGKKGDLFHERTYSAEDTKEIWIYALDDDDTMTVFGEGTNLIKVRLIGGQNRDTYTIENGKQLKMYDHKSKKNDFTTRKGRKKLTDNYETNVYNYKKLKNSSNQIIPSLGANPDDGFRIGLSDTFTNYGFERNPFSSQHILSANFYFATQGFEFDYSGEFANVFGNLNFIVEAQFNSPNYAVNFFGFGNETPNPEADDDDGLEVDLDYNRVKIRSLKVNPSLVYRGHSGSVFKFGLTYETNEVERTADRFLESVFPADDQLFEEQDFYGINASYAYENANNEAFPTLGMHFLLEAGFKKNVDASKGFAYITPEFGINYKLISSGQIVLATKVRAHVNFSEEFEFYQAASLGANTGLRGYRNERFTGNNAFVHSTDLRINLRKVKTGLLPMNIGIYGGLDYGRVWQDDEDSDRWHNSVGGGIFANIVEMFNLNLSAFNSDDGLRLAFGMGFAF